MISRVLRIHHLRDGDMVHNISSDAKHGHTFNILMVKV